MRPVSKAYDLLSAYKQLPLHLKEQPKAVHNLRLQDSSLRSRSQRPYRIAPLLQRVLWTCTLCVDRTMTISPRSLRYSCRGHRQHSACPDGFAVLLSDKKQPFSTRAGTLGVVLDSSDPWFDVIKVSSKPTLAAALSEALEKILCAGEVCPRELPSLFGWLQCSKSQLLRRTGKLALPDVRSLHASRQPKVKLDGSQVRAFIILRARLLAGRPREISAVPASKPRWCLLSRPASLRDRLSMPRLGVLIVPGSPMIVRTLGAVVSSSVVSCWAGGRKHVIGQTELYAVVLARIL